MRNCEACQTVRAQPQSTPLRPAPHSISNLKASFLLTNTTKDTFKYV